MNELVFFLEEPSAEAFLKGYLPKILPENIFPTFVVFEGKQDLLQGLGLKLRAWKRPCLGFVVLVDKDLEDCVALKERVVLCCQQAGKPGTLVRIVCHHLESWYLGDLQTVASTFDVQSVANLQRKEKYRHPDQLSNAFEELRTLSCKKYQKVSGSRLLGESFPADYNHNTSNSYRAFVRGLNTLMGQHETQI
jgi:hypothetical protein